MIFMPGLLFAGAMIVLELVVGSALIGWAGDHMVVDRTEKPGPYWASIVVQVAMWKALAAIWWFSG